MKNNIILLNNRIVNLDGFIDINKSSVEGIHSDYSYIEIKYKDNTKVSILYNGCKGADEDFDKIVSFLGFIKP